MTEEAQGEEVPKPTEEDQVALDAKLKKDKDKKKKKKRKDVKREDKPEGEDEDDSDVFLGGEQFHKSKEEVLEALERRRRLREANATNLDAKTGSYVITNPEFQPHDYSATPDEGGEGDGSLFLGGESAETFPAVLRPDGDQPQTQDAGAFAEPVAGAFAAPNTSRVANTSVAYYSGEYAEPYSRVYGYPSGFSSSGSYPGSYPAPVVGASYGAPGVVYASSGAYAAPVRATADAPHFVPSRHFVSAVGYNTLGGFSEGLVPHAMPPPLPPRPAVRPMPMFARPRAMGPNMLGAAAHMNMLMRSLPDAAAIAIIRRRWRRDDV